MNTALNLNNIKGFFQALEQQRTEYESRGVLYNLAQEFAVVESEGIQYRMHLNGKSEFAAVGGVWMPMPGTPYPDTLADLKWRVFFFKHGQKVFALALALCAAFIWYHLLLSMPEYKGIALKLQRWPALVMNTLFVLIGGCTALYFLASLKSGVSFSVNPVVAGLLTTGHYISPDILSGDGFIILVSESPDEQGHQYVRRCLYAMPEKGSGVFVVSVQYRQRELSICYTGTNESKSKEARVSRSDKELHIKNVRKDFGRESWGDYVDYIEALHAAMPKIISEIKTT